ncbi:hypothetical protein HRI_003992600 [Hibiscus trionum]|uniref:TF-B3 domain-containing protein n=1 Tax=Hibiscus trionum TaxID=183268 RepID=A0A9W7MIK2_HIBTR|nr:hypothetical protein HRI_003992600 [Hibiscus trionum]
MAKTEVIDEVYLNANDKKGLRILDHSRSLPKATGGNIRLHVSDGQEQWLFECKRLGGYMYYISGRDWTRFFLGSNINDKVTLYSRDESEGFYRIEVTDGRI